MKPAPGFRVSRVISNLPDEAALDRFFARHGRLVNAPLAQWLLERSRDQLRVDFSRALAFAQSAHRVAERVGDERLRALALRAAANALSVGGNNQGSIELHTQAIAAFERVGDEPELARTLSACMQPLLLLGRYDQALAAGDRARQLFSNHGDELRLARLDNTIGNLLHRQDRFAEAMVCYERAHQALAALGDADGIMSVIHNKAVTLTSLNQFRDALAAYQSAREIAAGRGLDQVVAQTDYNIAWLYYLRGEYSRAIEILQTAAAASKRTGDAYHAALSLLDLSEIYLELNLSVDARAMAEQAHARFTELGMGYEAAKALANAATSHGQEGKAFKALEIYASARTGMIREQNHAWPSLIDLYQAILLVDEGRLFEARRLCLAALACFETSGLSSRAAMCHLLLARIALRLDDAADGRRRCDNALAHLARAESPILTYHARLLHGHALTRVGDRAGAYASYQAARAALETLRSRLNGEELKIAFVKNKGEVYERLVHLCLDGETAAGGFEEAFSHIEQAKSRTLFDLMFQPVHALAREEGSESQLAHSIRELREELNWYYHLVELEQLRPGDQTNQRLTAFQREIGQREQDMVRALRELKLTDSSQADLHAPSVCSLEAIRAALPEGAALVEYFQVDDRIVLCLLDRDTLEIAPVSVMSRVSEHLRMLQFQFSKFRLGADYIRTFRAALLKSTQAHLHEMFNELLAPVWSRLEGRRLIIVPHGLLHYVPFHALYTGSQYVTDSCVVSYAPSASIYATCQQQPAGGGQGALGTRRRRRQGPAHRGGSKNRRREPARRAVVRRGRSHGAGPAHARARLPPAAHRVARLFPAREPDVLRDPAGRHIPERLRPVPASHARRSGDAERLRHGGKRRGRRRRAARDYPRAVLRRRQDAAAQSVERARPKHLWSHDASLSAHCGGRRSGDGAARDDARRPVRVSTPVSLGTICRHGQIRACVVFLRAPLFFEEVVAPFSVSALPPLW